MAPCPCVYSKAPQHCQTCEDLWILTWDGEHNHRIATIWGGVQEEAQGIFRRISWERGVRRMKPTLLWQVSPRQCYFNLHSRWDLKWPTRSLAGHLTHLLFRNIWQAPRYPWVPHWEPWYTLLQTLGSLAHKVCVKQPPLPAHSMGLLLFFRCLVSRLRTGGTITRTANFPRG